MPKRVTPEETYQCLRQWRIIDIRDHDLYNRNHIPGARWMSAENALQVAEEKFNKNEKFVLYDHGNDNTAENVARELEEAGFTGVSILEGGYTAWAKHKYPNARVNDVRTSR